MTPAKNLPLDDPTATGQGGDDAPGRTARRIAFGGFQLGGRTVTIDVEPDRILDLLTDVAGLNRILGPDVRVEPLGDDHYLWVLARDESEIRVETDLLVDHEAALCSWRSIAGADLNIEIRIDLRPAPAGRGCEVAAQVAYQPPWGLMGHLAAKLRGIDPALQGRKALKRLKMLLETGEIATAAHRRTA